MDNLNFPQEYLDSLYNFPFCEINSLKDDTAAEEEKSGVVNDKFPTELVSCDGENSSDTSAKKSADSDIRTKDCEENSDNQGSGDLQSGDLDLSSDPTTKKRKQEVCLPQSFIVISYSCNEI